jgi:hypothetical protein
MGIEQWWMQLDEPTQQWLINNNGDVVSPGVLAEIVAVAGPPTTDSNWAGDDDSEGFMLSDVAVDWVEAAANGEVTPQG